MINEERVRTMTRLAIYETTKGKQQLNISKYYKRDYIRYNMFKTAVAVTLAFLIMGGVYIFLNIGVILDMLNEIDLMQTAKDVGKLYLIFMAAYMLIAWVIYGFRYESIKSDVIIYNHNLKHMKDLYDKEEKEYLDRKRGRSVNLADEDIDNY